MSELWLAQHAWSPARIETALTCYRRFQLKHALRLEPAGARAEFNIDLEFGHAWHEASGYYTASNSNLLGSIKLALRLTEGWPLDTGDKAKNRSTLVRALIWYDAQFQNVPLRLLDVDSKPALEVPFSIPLFSDEERPERLQGVLDGVIEFGGEIWVLERKTTGSGIGGYYFSGFDPNVQVDVYCLAAHLMWPQWNVQGVLVEAAQMGVNYCRFERRTFRRTQGRLEESLALLQREVEALNEYSRLHPPQDGLWERHNPAACKSPRPCPYRQICTADPSMRDWTRRTQYAERPQSDTPFNRPSDSEHDTEPSGDAS